MTWMMRLWRANLRIPFRYDSDALGHAAHFKTILETGWYEYQPRLGVPYGQHYHDYPFSDDLHMAMAKILGWFTSDWVVAFNSYYLLTFLLCALTAVWFFRQCGLRPGWSVVLAVLFATAPYHFLRNEMHLFLSGYYLVPAGLVIVLWVARGEPVWRRRTGVEPGARHRSPAAARPPSWCSACWSTRASTTRCSSGCCWSPPVCSPWPAPGTSAGSAARWWWAWSCSAGICSPCCPTCSTAWPTAPTALRSCGCRTTPSSTRCVSVSW